MSYSRKPVNAEIQEKLKFYSHFHWFLIINGLLLFFSLKNGAGAGWVPIFFIWGSMVVFHYLKVFRPETLDSLGEPYGGRYLEGKEREELKLRELKRVNRLWKEEELV